MTTEAQKRASRNYYLKHKEYYSKKSGEYVKNMRKEKSDYKERIDKAIEYIEKQKTKMYKSRNKIAMYVLMKVEDILKGNDKE